MYRFQAFNRTISSTLFFPELLMGAETCNTSDISIDFGEVAPHGLDNAIKSGAFFQTNQQHFWLNVPHVARFLVSHGKQILIDPDKNTDEASLRVFILESCFKALLSQQQLTVLEGTAVKVGPYAVLFVMPSGFGKSTLATLFCKKGYPILTEEICAIDHDNSLYPSYPAINLWANISQQLGINFKSLKSIRPTVEKYRLDLDQHYHRGPLPIKLIYLVDYHKKNRLDLTEIANDKKLMALKNGSVIPSSIISPERGTHLLLCKLTHQVPLIQLTCPRWDYTMNQLGCLLEQLFNTIEQDVLKRSEYCEQL